MLRALLADPESVPQLVLDKCRGLPCSPATTGHQDCQPVPPPHKTILRQWQGNAEDTAMHP